MNMKILLSLMLMVMSTAVLAQQAAIGNSRVGTIQLLQQDEGIVTISSQNYGYREELLTVYYDGSDVDSSILDEGLVVRFWLNNDRVIVRMDLLGPSDRIQSFFEH